MNNNITVASDNTLNTTQLQGSAFQVSPQQPLLHMLRPALGLGLVSLLGFGLLYSAAVSSLGQVLWPAQAQGSLLQNAQGQVVGSRLVAQPFTQMQYFWPRPSSANYDPMAMAGSNLARSNPVLQQQLQQRVANIVQSNGVAARSIPSDLVTSSGSGMDPDISPQAAAIQVARVAKARGLTQDQVGQVLQQQLQTPQLGVFGQPRVNVLQLNLALDQLQTSVAKQP